MTSINDILSLGHENIADLLIRKGANINFQDTYGHSPLHQTALNGDL